MFSEGLNVEEAVTPAERAEWPSAAAYSELGRLHTPPRCDLPAQPHPIPSLSRQHSRPHGPCAPRAAPDASAAAPPGGRRGRSAGREAAGRGRRGGFCRARAYPGVSVLVDWLLSVLTSRLALRNWFRNICSASPHPVLPVHNYFSVLCWLLCRAPRVPALTMFTTAKSQYAKDENALITCFNSFPRDFPKSGPAELSFPQQV